MRFSNLNYKINGTFIKVTNKTEKIRHDDYV